MLQVNLRNALVVLLIVIVGKVVADFIYNKWNFKVPGLV